MSRKINKIVIHHSVSPRDQDLNKSVASFDRNHAQRLHTTKNGFGYHIAYHFVIWPKWEYVETRPISEVWYHGSDYKVNKESVGICLTGNFDVENPTNAQYVTLRRLIEWLEKEYGPLTIHGHNEFARKSCPGRLFDMRKVLMLFYEKLWRDNYTSTPADERMFKDPDAFIERTKNLSTDQQISEMTFLLAILAEKLWWTKKYNTEDK